MSQILLIGTLGLIGVFSRWGLDSLVGKWFEGFPYGVLLINALGSFLAGVTYVAGTERALLSPSVAVGLLVGFCGGFTTFSAYSLQAVVFLERGELVRGLAYFSLSPLVGLLSAFLGLYSARALWN